MVTLGPDPITEVGYAGAASGLHLFSGAVVDTGSTSTPILTISGPKDDIRAEGGSLTLTRPIDVGPPLDENENCPLEKPDYFGIHVVSGFPQLFLLGGGSFHCVFQDAICFQSDGTCFIGSDGTTASGAQSLFQHAGCAGIYVEQGSVFASNARFFHDHYGVIQRTQGHAGVGTGAILPDGSACSFCTSNSIACTSPDEPGFCDEQDWASVDIWNNSEGLLHAEGIAFDGQGRVDYVCADGGYFNNVMTACSCTGSACAPLAPDQTPPVHAQTVTSADETAVPATASFIDASGATLGVGCN